MINIPSIYPPKLPRAPLTVVLRLDHLSGLQFDHGPLGELGQVLGDEGAAVRVHVVGGVLGRVADQLQLTVLHVRRVTVVEEDQVPGGRRGVIRS